MKRRKHVERVSMRGGKRDRSKQTETRSTTTSSPVVEDEHHENTTRSQRMYTTRRKMLTDDGASAQSAEALSLAAETIAAEGQESDGIMDDHDSDEEESTSMSPIIRSREEIDDEVSEAVSDRESPISRSHTSRGLFTPSKAITDGDSSENPKIQRNANRSARRKSTRTLIENTVLGYTSDNEEDEEVIAEEIYNSDQSMGNNEDFEATMNMDEGELSLPITPSRKRGRPKGSGKKHRSPTPPKDLSAHEKYFFQNRGSRSQTSNNNLSSIQLLDHEEYFSISRTIEDHHEESIKRLEAKHSDQFNLWQFELNQNFNLCLYGFGSKRSLLLKFADHIHRSFKDADRQKVVVVNGYAKTLTIRDVLKTVAAAVSDSIVKSIAPVDMLEGVLSLLEEDPSNHISLLVHSVDALPLRRPINQTILSRLSSHPQIHLVATADHPSFPLLWDSSLRSAFNFCFHDCTTFQPYSAEFDVVDEVHELLGRTGRRVGGKEGVSFVLKSLPENARNLFRVLIGEQLASMDDDLAEAIEEEDEMEQPFGAPKRLEPGVEYRILYQKAVEEFICSNEMNFRTLLKEFHDHQMIQSRKDTLGTEILSVPFRKEELETILEDIMS